MTKVMSGIEKDTTYPKQAFSRFPSNLKIVWIEERQDKKTIKADRYKKDNTVTL